MFRPMKRKSHAISNEDARALLASAKRGVFAVNGDDDYPFAFPVDYYYDEPAGSIFFHGAKTGYKVDALKRCNKICFTVIGPNRFEENDWAPYVQSVIVYGTCTLVDDDTETEKRVRELALKYYPTRAEVENEISKHLAGVQLYRIDIEHLTGKQVHEK